MFESRNRGGGGNSANRWLIVAGAGLVILAFVARMLLDIGHTKVSDLAGVLRPDTAAATAAAPAPVEPAPATPLPPQAVTPTAAAPAPPATSPTGATPKGTRVTVANPPPVLRLDTTTPGSRYVVQIGAFGSEPNAEKLGQRATALGFQAAVIPQVRNGTTLYLVRVSRAGGADDARMVSDSLASALGVKAVVLRPGQ